MNDKLILIVGMVFFIGFCSSVTLSEGIVLNTSVSNSSVDFSFSINVSSFLIESSYIFLNEINYTNASGSYDCGDLNYSVENAVVDVSEFNCSVVEVENPVAVPDEVGRSSDGGSSFIYIFQKLSEEEFTKSLRRGMKIQFEIDKNSHTLELSRVEGDLVLIKIFSEVQEKWLGVGEEWFVELTNDTVYDIYVRVNSIQGSFADLTIKEIQMEIEEGVEVVISKVDDDMGMDIEGGDFLDRNQIILGVFIVLILIIVFFIGLRVRKKKRQ